MADPVSLNTHVGHSVHVSRDDVYQALRSVALKRLREQCPGIQIDEVDWHAKAEVFGIDEVRDVTVNFAKS